MKEKIQELEKLKLKLTADLKEWVKDKSIPLDERWEVFFASGLGDHETCYEDFVNLNSDDYCDRVSRHEVIYLSDIRDWGIDSLESDEDYDAFREDVLERFIKSFEFDW